MIAFTVPGQPYGKGRPIVGKAFGSRFTTLRTPEKTANYESMVRVVAHQAMAGRPLLEGPVRVDMAMNCQIPASWSPPKQAKAMAGAIRPLTKPDADNTIKAVFDAMNGVVWKDDVQACEIVLSKRYAAVPGVSVIVTPLEVA